MSEGPRAARSASRARGVGVVPDHSLRRPARVRSSERLMRPRRPLSCQGPGVMSSSRFANQTIRVASTSVQKPSIEKPPTIASVRSSISIATKNQAMPSVRIASGNVMKSSSGLRIVFSTPNTAAAAISAPALWTCTFGSSATTASTSAFVSHEIARRASSGGPGRRRPTTSPWTPRRGPATSLDMTGA